MGTRCGHKRALSFVLSVTASVFALCFFVVCVLKQFEEETETETKGFVTVLVARGDGDITMKTVPVLPAMTSVEVCKYQPLFYYMESRTLSLFQPVLNRTTHHKNIMKRSDSCSVGHA